MEPADAPASTGVMIALLPTTSDWCKLELPHMTLVYAGTTDALKPSDFNELAKDAASLAMMSAPLYLKVMGVEVFGDTERVDVLKFMPTPELWAMRRFVERWNKSQFPFKPHATIGPADGSGFISDTVSFVTFDKIFVGFGEENLTFLMRRGSYA